MCLRLSGSLCLPTLPVKPWGTALSLLAQTLPERTRPPSPPILCKHCGCGGFRPPRHCHQSALGVPLHPIIMAVGQGGSCAPCDDTVLPYTTLHHYQTGEWMPNACMSWTRTFRPGVCPCPATPSSNPSTARMNLLIYCLHCPRVHIQSSSL